MELKVVSVASHKNIVSSIHLLHDAERIYHVTEIAGQSDLLHFIKNW